MPHLQALGAARTADDVGFYGAVLWPGSVLIAELLAQGPPLDGATVLCLGAGTGLEALVAALCGATALATDVYPFALSLVTEAAALNGVADRVDVAAFDVTRRDAPLPPAEIVLLGDLLYLSDLTAAVAQRVYRRMLAMRAYMRAKTVDGVDDNAIAERVGLTGRMIEDMYHVMAIANYEDRFVIPTTHREVSEDAYDVRGSCGFSFGNGCSGGNSETELFGAGRRKVVQTPTDIFKEQV